MATSSGDFAERESRWRRLGKLGLEAAFRELAFDSRSISKIRGLGQTGFLAFDDVQLQISNLDARAVFFAVVGRDISHDKKSFVIDTASRGRLHAFEEDGRYDVVCTETEAAAFFVNLSTNTNLEEVGLYQIGAFGSTLPILGNALRSNFTLRSLSLVGINMGEKGVRCVMDRLKGNKTLVSLRLANNVLGEGIRNVAEFLTTNTTLKDLYMDTTSSSRGAHYISSALELNTTLEKLGVGICLTREDMECLLKPLSGEMQDPVMSPIGPKNTTLRALRITNNRSENHSADSLARMIRTNKTLSSLDLTWTNLLPEDWKDQNFPALRENRTLQGLLLQHCKGLDGKDVLGTLLDVVRSGNTGLTKIKIPSGHAFNNGIYYNINSWQAQIDGEIRANMEYRARLRGQRTVETRSGRLVLCGYEFAGKTAIRNTMERIEYGTPRSHYFHIRWKKLMQRFPSLHRLLLGNDAHRELMSRTRGFDILVLSKYSHLKSVWDFAGQREYYALHDYLFPDIKSSCFLYVCSCRCPPDAQYPKGVIKDQTTMRDECEYWMRFITSNSKPLQTGDGHARQLPRVRFVLTKKDMLDSGEFNVSRQKAELVVRQLKGVFKDVIELCETVEVVNAHSSKDVKRMLALTNDTLEEILAHRTEYAICEEVRDVLNGWSASNQCKPVMSVEDFFSTREGKFNFTQTPMPVREALLSYLNDLGEIIFPKGLDFIVVNPRWFGVGVLGSLIDAFKGAEDRDQRKVSECANVLGHRMQSWKLVHDNGYVDRKDVEDLLKQSLHTTHLQQAISSDMLIELMIQLELCFEKEPGKRDSPLFLPALFDDDRETAAKGKRQLEWKLVRTGQLLYLGRRLECENKAITFLTPGFFPRLQVRLRNYIHQKQWMENPGFVVDRNLICFAENGIEVLVEYSGDFDYFVDILVRSSKPHSDALKFIDEHVIKEIQQFCASTHGCQGVLLVEAVIRPVCVKDLHLCIDRKFHSVLVSTLQGQLEIDKVYNHIWSHRIEDVKATDFALDLLEGEPLQFQSSANTPEVSSFMAAGSVSSFNDQFPKLFYPSIEDVGVLRMLDMRLNLGKKMPIKLHLLCDHIDGSHKLVDQPGRTILLNWKECGYDLPITKLAVTLLWASVGVGTSIVGVPVRSLQVDNWIQKLFNVPEMPAIDAKTLHQMMNPTEAPKPLSEQEILKALERYWKIDPCTQGLKEILNLQDGAKFWNDFRLRKVVYTEAAHLNKIGWVCDRHYRLGLQQRILQSVYH